jgi:uncharacterized protein YbbC (DUF1343 family)
MKTLTAVLLLAVSACASTPPQTTQLASTTTPRVKPGIEVFLAHPPEILRGKRIGLITNQSGIDTQRRTTIDLLSASKDVKLVALFSPEHGIRGVAETRVNSGTDEKTGLPIYSLYGETYKPTAQMLQGVDALLYDIQDLGVRQYTFESTLALALQAAAENKIPIVVLDRPNPVTGNILEGNILEPPFQSFVGIYPVLSRHGMTVGELARMYNAEQKIGADLMVVPMEGWQRNMWWDETGLPWVNPSPNIRRLEAAIHYPGTVFFEAVNVSEGRGTRMPFEQIGASWLNNTQLAATMNAMKLPGIRFEPIDIEMAPTARKYAGQTIKGVRFQITDRNAYRPLATSLLVIDAIRKMHPDSFQWAGANAREPRSCSSSGRTTRPRSRARVRRICSTSK